MTQKIPFSPPFVDADVEQEVLSALRSGWITSGPKVLALEQEIKQFTNANLCICVNSWTSAAFLTFKYLGIGAGDEVIIPAYTYAATALAVLHVGATPVMVDVTEDFTLDVNALEAKITPNTKAIMPVDFAGLPANYKTIYELVNSQAVQSKFIANSEVQKQLNRIAIVGDCAHAFGAQYMGKPIGSFMDFAVYSLHAVKNITTAEGGAICLHSDKLTDVEGISQWFKLHRLNGQSKDSFTKTNSGNWRYDIPSLGFKLNMPDVCAAIGLAQIRKYDQMLLPERKRLFSLYVELLSKYEWATIPSHIDHNRESSFHLFALRVKGISEARRDAMIDFMTEQDVSVNVHFVPLPLMTLFKNMGYQISDYPMSFSLYANEISLPIYSGLTDANIAYIVEKLDEAFKATLNL